MLRVDLSPARELLRIAGENPRHATRVYCTCGWTLWQIRTVDGHTHLVLFRSQFRVPPCE